MELNGGHWQAKYIRDLKRTYPDTNMPFLIIASTLGGSPVGVFTSFS